MKKILTFLLSISMILCTGCGKAASESSSSTDSSSSSVQADSKGVDVNVIALKGPTAMGMVKFMSDSDEGIIKDNKYNFSIVASPDEVTPKLAKGEVDIAAVPANLGSVLYNKMKGNIEVLAINTLGVIYIVEDKNNINSMSDLKGKTIYASGKGATPEYSLKYLLKENGINPETDVKIEWKSEHSECVTAMAQDEGSIAMLPQPFVAAAQAKNENIRIAIDFTKEWDKLQEGKENASTLITGIVVARKDFVEKNPEAVKQFMSHYDESVKYINSSAKDRASLIEHYGIISAPIAEKALPYCNISFITGNEMKDKLSGYLTVLFNENPQSIGGKIPDEGFYYTK